MGKIFPALFLILLTGCQAYQVENGKWNYVQWDEGRGRTATEVLGADSHTFKPINSDYSKDDKTVYHFSSPIIGADSHSFVYLGKNYAKDNSHVYYSAKPIEGADPNTFEIVHAGLGRDKKDFYCLTYALGVIDPSSFKLINDKWARDQKAYYAFSSFINYIGKLDCDYSSMKILKKSYAMDKNRGYWEGIPIEGVDLETFQEVSEVFAKDRYRNYVLNKVR